MHHITFFPLLFPSCFQTNLETFLVYISNGYELKLIKFENGDDSRSNLFALSLSFFFFFFHLTWPFARYHALQIIHLLCTLPALSRKLGKLFRFRATTIGSSQHANSRDRRVRLSRAQIYKHGRRLEARAGRGSRPAQCMQARASARTIEKDASPNPSEYLFFSREK